MAKAHFFGDRFSGQEPQVGDRMLCGWVPNRLPKRHNVAASVVRLCGNCARLDPWSAEAWRAEHEETRTTVVEGRERR